MIPKFISTAMLNPLPTPRHLVRAFSSTPKSLTGKIVVLTGGSSGIGAEAARLLVTRGATVVLVARSVEPLEAMQTELGAQVHIRPTDLSIPDEVAALSEEILKTFGRVDILINNAGRSIRRPVAESLDRQHDFVRTMAINYFGPINLTLGLLPGFLQQGSGHIINVSTWGVEAGAMPKFAAYTASKAALSSFSNSLRAELAATDITVSNLNYPLIKTPMISPTAKYDSKPTLSALQAAEWIIRAIDEKPNSLTPVYTQALRVVGLFSNSTVGAIISKTI